MYMFLGGGGVVVANILAVYAFDRFNTSESRKWELFTCPGVLSELLASGDQHQAATPLFATPDQDPPGGKGEGGRRPRRTCANNEPMRHETCRTDVNTHSADRNLAFQKRVSGG